jgi:hypothetical protein
MVYFSMAGLEKSILENATATAEMSKVLGGTLERPNVVWFKPVLLGSNGAIGEPGIQLFLE